MAPKNNERFASIVEEAFAALGVTQAEFSKRGGPSDTTLRKIIDGEPVGISARTLRGLDIAFGWSAGSAARTLAGGDPTPDESIQPSEPESAEASDNERSIADWSNIEVHERLIAQGWEQARALTQAVNEVENPPESLREAARRIIFTISGYLIMRILESGYAMDMESWLQRIYTEREQFYRELTVGEPNFPWATDAFESHADAAASVVRHWGHKKPPTSESDSDPEGGDNEDPAAGSGAFLPAAARTTPPGYRKGQGEQGEASVEES